MRIPVRSGCSVYVCVSERMVPTYASVVPSNPIAVPLSARGPCRKRGLDN